MARITLLLAFLLIVLGLVGYFGSSEEAPSKTALIPSAIGVVLTVLGVAALNERLRKHAMHFAAMVSLLGFIAVTVRVMVKAISDSSSLEGRPIIFQAITALILLAHTACCVMSFISVRRARKKG